MPDYNQGIIELLSFFSVKLYREYSLKIVHFQFHLSPSSTSLVFLTWVNQIVIMLDTVLPSNICHTERKPDFYINIWAR